MDKSIVLKSEYFHDLCDSHPAPSVGKYFTELDHRIKNSEAYNVLCENNSGKWLLSIQSWLVCSDTAIALVVSDITHFGILVISQQIYILGTDFVFHWAYFNHRLWSETAKCLP